MSNERIDLEYLLEEDSLLQDLNWSIARFEQVEKLVKQMTAELKRCYEEIDALRSITQDWVKIETFTDDGKDLSVDMEDSDGNCFSGYINRASE
jgi:hypothetical protein